MKQLTPSKSSSSVSSPTKTKLHHPSAERPFKINLLASLQASKAHQFLLRQLQSMAPKGLKYSLSLINCRRRGAI